MLGRGRCGLRFDRHCGGDGVYLRLVLKFRYWRKRVCREKAEVKLSSLTLESFTWLTDLMRISKRESPLELLCRG
jgi:hypothetical protein